MTARRNRRPSVLRVPAPEENSEPLGLMKEPKAPKGNKHAVSLRIAAACSGYTLSQIAKRTGWGAETVRRYVRQGHRPSVDFVAAVAERFNVSVGWLVLGEGTMEISGRVAVPAPAIQVDNLLRSLEEHVNGLEEQVGGLVKKGVRRRSK